LNDLHSVPAVMRLPEVIETVGLSRASIYRLMAAGQFPQKVQLGPSSVGWLRHEVREWLLTRANARLPVAEEPRRAA
jgi:prophage regulatory protein